VYEAWLEEDERPTHNPGDPFGLGGGAPPPAPAPPKAAAGPMRLSGGWGDKDVNPFARMDPLGGLGGLGVPSAPAAPAINPPPSTQTRDLLSGDSLDPLGVLGAAPVREKPKESIFNASSRKQLKKKD